MGSGRETLTDQLLPSTPRSKTWSVGASGRCRAVVFSARANARRLVFMVGFEMSKNPILDLQLCAVMRAEIALPLQHVLHIYTVGGLLKAWNSPKNHRSIEQVFDSPEQARNAVAVCTAWMGIQTAAAHEPVTAWWHGDERVQLSA